MHQQQRNTSLICEVSILEKVAALLSEEIPEWSGTPTELAEALQLEAKPNLLTKHLNVNASRLLHECHTQYENIRTHAGRKIVLKRVSEQRDGCDDDFDSGGGT